MDEEKDLEEWLKRVKTSDANTIDYSFPSDQLKSDYLETIESRSDIEVSNLLLKFLIPSGSLGSEKRLIAYAESKVSGRLGVSPPWEGVTWILDLLPDNPRAAIATLDAYFATHCRFMPDGRMHGIADATEIIRAKYIERPRSSEDAIQLLLNETPRVFEHLVERLYSKMGYATTLTPSQKDGGFDVLAVRDEPGQRARVHIECKRWAGNVGEPIVRGLFGVVADSKATSGICVTTSDLTEPAKAFVVRNPQLNYISGHVLVRLLNEYLGPIWFYSIERLVRESKASIVASTA